MSDDRTVVDGASLKSDNSGTNLVKQSALDRSISRSTDEGVYTEVDQLKKALKSSKKEYAEVNSSNLNHLDVIEDDDDPSLPIGLLAAIGKSRLLLFYCYIAHSLDARSFRN